MATSRLAHHFPALFGPSRRAAWRLLLVRRALAAGALLLAVHLSIGATKGSPVTKDQPTVPKGSSLSLPLAMPGDHLSAGDEVAIYLPGSSQPLIPKARMVGGASDDQSVPVARVVVAPDDVPTVVREMSAERAGEGGFVVVQTD